jgi:hypothetical protein
MPNLWPPVGPSPPRTMAEMLYDAAGDLATITNNKLDFYVDAVGVADPPAGPATKIRYNCYIRVIKTGNVHLFFQVTTPAGGPFEAELGTPEGERFPPIKDEAELVRAISQIMQRPRTTEVIGYLLRLA